MRQFIAGIICGVAFVLTIMHYHVVRDKRGISLIPKIDSNLRDIYVDVRKFDLEKWKDHANVAAAIIRRNNRIAAKSVAERQPAGEQTASLQHQFQGVVQGLLQSGHQANNSEIATQVAMSD